MTRALRIAGTALVVAVYFVASPVGYAIFAIWSALPTRAPERRRRRFQRIVHRAFRAMHAVLRGLSILDFDPRKVRGRVPHGPCLLVANHPTLTDSSAILATIDPVVYAVKPSLHRQRWARPLFESVGAFEGPGDSPFAAGRFVDEAVARLASGQRVLVFPEGTRSSSVLPDPFGRAALEIAIRAGVPIVPLSIRCTPRWLTKESRFLDPPDEVPRLSIHVLEPIPAPPPGSSSRALRDIVQRRIRTELENTADG